MHDQGLPRDLRRGDVAAKACPLPVEGLFAPVKVEPRFAHRDHPRARGDFGDFVDVGFAVVGVFGVHGPGTEEEPRTAREECFEARQVRVVAPDRDGGNDPGLGHAVEHRVDVRVESVGVEMGVGVDESHGKRR